MSCRLAAGGVLGPLHEPVVIGLDTAAQVLGGARGREFLCLTSQPGTPIHDAPAANSAVIGYTRQVVAFYGLQEGRWISIQMYDGSRLGWLDGTTIRPFQPA